MEAKLLATSRDRAYL